MTTPHDAEREAREAVMLAHGVLLASPTLETAQGFLDALDAYRAAVYARAMRDAVWVVEGMMRPKREDHNVLGPCPACDDNQAAVKWNAPLACLKDALAALPAPPSREGASDEAQ